ITDTAGNSLPFTNSYGFTTGEALGDGTAPAVAGVSPPDGATSVAVNSPVVVRLSEPMNPLTVTATTVTLASGAGPVGVTRTLTDANQQLTVDPAAPLAPATVYTLRLAGLTDIAG